MSQDRDAKSSPEMPAYDNPSRNKGDLRQEPDNKHDPKSGQPVGHPSDKKLGQKPPARRTPID
jgi:hypothetical protein